MNHPKPIQIIDLAFKGACIRIEDIQKQIQLIESFGEKAMIKEDFYHPENLKRNASLFNLKELRNDMEELISLATELKEIREKYFDNQFESAINQMFDNQ